jgi:hypothetical protein
MHPAAPDRTSGLQGFACAQFISSWSTGAVIAAFHAGGGEA